MNEMSKYFKPSVLALSPYSSARDEYEGRDGIFLDANENPFSFDNNRYPDPQQKALKREIGLWRDVCPKNIFLGNGSDEIIDLLIKSTCVVGKDRILCLKPSYGMYKVSSAINEISLDLVELNPDMTVNASALFDKLNDDHKLVFICSPNNPNGGLVEKDLIKQLLENCNGLVIIDEAYIDFSDSISWIKELVQYKKLIVLQTFSKSLGAAGIRLGMAFMNEDLIYYLNKIKPPYNIGTPNQELAIDRLKNIDTVHESVREIIKQRELMKESLNGLDIVLFVFPSSANFLLVRFRNAAYVFNQLKSQKIIVRDRSNQKHCEECLRISIGTAFENSQLLKALNEIDEITKNET